MVLEDPELPGANSLLILIRNCKKNGPGGSLELPGVHSLLILIRKCKENGSGGSGALGSKFLIVCRKEL